MRPVALALAAALSTGCVIHGDGPDGRRHIGEPGAPGVGDARFTVRLDGAACDAVPEVASLRVQLDGARIVVDELQDCPGEGDELVVADLPAGLYTWTILALDAEGFPLYDGTSTFEMVDGDESILADLRPAGAGTATVTFLWTFEGESCAEAGVEVVRVVYADVDAEVACAEPGAAEGVVIEGVAPGGGVYVLEGLPSSGEAPTYRAQGTVGSLEPDVTVEVDLASVAPPSGETLEVVWTFAGQGSCPLAGVDRVRVVRRSGDTVVADETTPCSAGLVALSGLALGAYTLDAEALDAGGAVRFATAAVAAQVEPGTTRLVVDLAPTP